MVYKVYKMVDVNQTAMMKCLLLLQILVILVPTIMASEEPEVPTCSYWDAYEVECEWKKPQDPRYSFFVIWHHYPNRSMVKGLSGERKKNGITYQYFRHHAIMATKLTVFLAKDCKDTGNGKHLYVCEAESHPNITFECYKNNVRLRYHPINFRWLPSSLRFEWEKPERKDAQLDFYFFLKPYIMYKLIFRFVECSTRQLDDEEGRWRVWYMGEKARFSPLDLEPGCTYMAKVQASIREGEWSDPSETLTIYISIKNIPVELEEKVDLFVIVYVLASIVFIVIFISAAVQICCCIWPEKFKVPKPVIMVKHLDLQPKTNRRYSTTSNENPTPLYVSGLSDSLKIKEAKCADVTQNQGIEVLQNADSDSLDSRTCMLEKTTDEGSYYQSMDASDSAQVLHCSGGRNENLIVGLEVPIATIKETPHLTPNSIRKKAISNQYVDETCRVRRMVLNSSKDLENYLEEEEERNEVRFTHTRSSSSSESLNYVTDMTNLDMISKKKKMAEINFIRSKCEEEIPEYVQETKLKEDSVREQLDTAAVKKTFCTCDDIKERHHVIRSLTSQQCTKCQKPLSLPGHFDLTSEKKKKLRPLTITWGSSANAHFRPGSVDSVTSI